MTKRNNSGIDALARLIKKIADMPAGEKERFVDDFCRPSRSPYMYFWAYEYRHYLRDASLKKRKAIYHAFEEAGLRLSGESEQHEKIIREIMKCGSR